MLKIHHLNQSRSERTVWLAEELGLDYELVRHQRDPQTFRSPPSLCSCRRWASRRSSRTMARRFANRAPSSNT